MDPFRQLNRRLVQPPISLSDLPKSPVHGFLHKIALVQRASADVREKTHELPVIGVLVMNSQPRHHRISCSLDKLLLVFAPPHSRFVRPRSLVKEFAAGRVAHSPVVELPDPTLHLSLRYFLWVIDECGKNACIMNSCRPQFQSQLVVSFVLPGQPVHCRSGYAERLLGGDSETYHSFDVSTAAMRPEFAEDQLECHLFSTACCVVSCFPNVHNMSTGFPSHSPA